MKLDAYLKYMLWMVIGLAFFFFCKQLLQTKTKACQGNRKYLNIVFLWADRS